MADRLPQANLYTSLSKVPSLECQSPLHKKGKSPGKFKAEFGTLCWQHVDRDLPKPAGWMYVERPEFMINQLRSNGLSIVEPAELELLKLLRDYGMTAQALLDFKERAIEIDLEKMSVEDSDHTDIGTPNESDAEN
ncbi:hypothetical protein BBJ28_00013500 [Nothophytophthora sp. Chile5]|nr:hypothetical protein BBJ28_00013500 [Nothophytophthora sp. Chile5]